MNLRRFFHVARSYAANQEPAPMASLPPDPDPAPLAFAIDDEDCETSPVVCESDCEITDGEPEGDGMPEVAAATGVLQSDVAKPEVVKAEPDSPPTPLRQPQSGDIYHHGKSGVNYKVHLVATDEATETPVVVYHLQSCTAKIWTRSLDSWNELVNLDDGRKVRRFEFDPAATELRRLKEAPKPAPGPAPKLNAYIVAFTATDSEGDTQDDTIVVAAETKAAAMAEAYANARAIFTSETWNLGGWSAETVKE